MKLIRRPGGNPTDRVDGVVLGTGRWVLVGAVTDVADVDGFELVRRRDVRRVRRAAKGFRRFQRRVRSAEGLVPLPRPAVELPLDDLRDALRVLADARLLVALHVEADDPDALFPGQLVRLGKRSADLAFVRPDGRWEHGARRFRYDEITRVTVGSRYLAAFATHADPFAPDAPRPAR